MTISFSGLASGLDTTSWVESLVALKQAKVETLEEEKENVLDLQETLSNIKSFFSSFRSMVEKVTDAKFGIASMDLFAQNLATSSNMEVLTGSATVEAEEGSYDVLVDNLATETKAESGYSIITTIVQTGTATMDSKLSSLGVKAGEIGIKVNGIESVIEIEENDSIADFIEKLQNIGVEADYNEETGVFSINVSDDDIRDIDGTGIVEALHLEGVNEGYVSNNLQVSKVDTIFSAATDSTLLSEFGVKPGVITIHANDTDYNITITDTSTFGSFIADLKKNNIDADLTDDGYFTISDANITNEGSTNIIDALGLESETFNKSQITDDLTHTTVTIEETEVDLNTLLKDIGEGSSIADGSTVIVKNSNNELSTITINSTSTLGDLLEGLTDAGLYADYSNGIIEISGGTITGGSLDIENILGLTETVGGRYTNSNSLYAKHTVIVDATLDTELGNYGIENSLGTSDRTVNIYNNNGALISSTVVSANTTLEELVNYINQTGTIDASLEDGSLVIKNGYIENDILEASMGLEITSRSSYALGSVMNVTTNIEATGDSELGAIIAALGSESSVSGGYNLSFNGTALAVNENTTLDGLINQINAQGGSAVLTQDGKLLIEGGTVSGSVANALGIYAVIKTVSVSSTGETLYTKTEVTADENTKFSDLGINNSSYVINSSGTPTKTIQVNGTTTIGDFLDDLRAEGIDGNISNGKITLNSTSNKYITGTLADTLGLTHTAVTTTASATQSSDSPIYCTGTVLADLNTELGDIGAITASSDSIIIYNVNQTAIGTITGLTTSSTVNDLFDELSSYGITGTISDGVITLNSVNGNYADGTIMDNLGMGAVLGSSVTTTAGATVSSGSAITYTDVIYVTEDTLLSDIVDMDSLGGGSTAGSTLISRPNEDGFMSTVSRLTESEALAQGYTIIKTAQDVDNIRNNLSGKYILMNDIDMSSLGSFESIGDSSNAFTGELNGNGYTISNLNITPSDGTSLGLFATLDGASIRNLRLENINTSTTIAAAIGTLAGQAENSIIDNVSAECIITTVDTFTAYFLGGLVGGVINTTISNSYTTGNLEVESISIGGLVGIATNNVMLTNTWSGANITSNIAASNTYAGGLIGSVQDGSNIEITDSYAYGSVEGGQNISKGAILGGVYSSGTSSATANITATNVYYDISSPNAPGCDATALNIFNIINGSLGGATGTFIQNVTPLTEEEALAQGYTLIKTAEDLNNIRNNLSGKYILMNDIDLSGINWVSIGSSSSGFSGELNGNGYVIKNLTMTANSSNLQGLFGYIENGKVSNLGLEAAHIAGSYLSGILSEEAKNAIISNCYSTGFVGGDDSCGGLVGAMTGGTITNSYSSASVYSGVVGGLIGSGDGTTISNCYATGSLSGGTQGGLVGKGKVYISNSYATGHISSGSSAPGLSYGGLIAEASSGSTVTNCYFNTETTGQTVGDGGGYVTNIQGVTTAELNQLIADGVLPQAVSPSPLFVKSSADGSIEAVDISDVSTISDLLDVLSSYGITGTVNNGIISLSSSNGNYITGSLADALGIGVVETGSTTVTSAVTTTSSTAITYTANGLATEGTKLSDIVSFSGNQYVTVYSDGSISSIITITSNTTVSDFFDKLGNSGITASISNGVMSFNSSGQYMGNNTFLQQLGITTSTSTSTIRHPYTITSSSPVTYTESTTATESTTLGELGLSRERLAILNSNASQVGSIDVYASTTIGSLLSSIRSYGMSAYMSNGTIYISAASDGSASAIAGDGNNWLTDIFGIDTYYNYKTVVHSKSTTSSSVLTYSVRERATLSTTLSELGYSSGGTFDLKISIFGGPARTKSVSFTGSDSISDVIDKIYSETSVNVSFDSDASKLKVTLPSGNESESFSYTSSMNIFDTTSTLFAHVTKTADASTRLYQLGMTSAQTIVLGGSNGMEWDPDYTYTTITIYVFNDIEDLLSKVGGGTISNGKVTLDAGNGSYFIKSMSSGLASALNLSYGNGYTYTLSTEVENVSNSNSDWLGSSETYTLSRSTTFADLGLSGSATYTVGYNYSSNTYQRTVYSSDTVGDFMDELDSVYGMSVSISNGELSIWGGSYYIESMSSSLESALNAVTGYGHSYIEVTQTTGSNGNSNTLYGNGVTNISNGTTFNQIGLTSGTSTVVNYNGNNYTVSVTGSETLGDYISKLASYGITGSISGGKLKLEGSDNAYILSGSYDFTQALKINLGEGHTYDTDVLNMYENTDSDQFTIVGVNTLSASTTLGDLGLSGDAYITVVQNGTQKTITVNAASSLNDIISNLGANGITAGISNGKLTINGNDNSFVLGMSSNLQDIFDLETGENNSYTVTIKDSYYNPDSAVLKHVDTTTLSSTTLLSEIDGYNNGNGLIKISNASTGNSQTIQINENWTVNELLYNLSLFGINGYLDSTGQIRFASYSGAYLEAVSGGSNLLDVLNITNTSFGTSTVHSNNTSDELGYIDTAYATGLTMLGDLKDNLDNGITFDSSGNASLVVRTESEEGNRNVTINFTKTQTLQDVINRLAELGITASISNGVFNVSANAADYEITGTIGDFLKADNSKSYYTETSYVSDNLGAQTVVNMDDNARLDEFGILGGNIIINQDGVENTVNIDLATVQTVGDFRNLLSLYGFTTNIDSSGRLSVSGSGNSSLETAPGGSNILDVFGLTNWTQVGLSQNSDNLAYEEIEINPVQMSDKIADLTDSSGNSLGITAGQVYVCQNGSKTKVNIDTNETLSSLASKLEQFGITLAVSQDGKLYFDSKDDTYLTTDGLDSAIASNILTVTGTPSDWSTLHSYESEPISVIEINTIQANATRDTLLSELGVSTGEYYIYNKGVKYTALISSDETLGSFMDTLKSFGLETSLVQGAGGAVLSIIGQGDSYVAKSASTTNASNVVEKLFTNGIDESKEYSGQLQTSEVTTTYSTATEDTLLSTFDTPWGGSKLTAEGDLSVTIDGKTSIIEISADETIGSLLNKFKSLGIEATLNNGQIMLQSGFKTFTINSAGTTSSILVTTGLTYQKDLGGYAASTAVVESTTTIIEEKTLSSANHADLSTKLGTLNISGGTLTVYRNGERAAIEIQADDTFSDLRAKISSKFSDVDLKFENGYLIFYSNSGNTISVGATTDTSNFSAITGIQNDENGNAISARELYKVNSDSVITASGLFRKGQVTEGTFTIGDAAFTITNTTTLADIISQINSSDEANATAYWDNIDGKFVIKSRTTGAAYINIEAGTSNFTDIMGFTTTETDSTGKTVNRMNMDVQELGQNARFSINGTSYTSASNTITSDISRIKGLTINLKGLTEGTAVTLTVERDKETLANAISDVVDSYNELMKNVDEAIAVDGNLHSETTLKLIRNQLRNIMTSSDSGTTVFRNLDAIGISVSDASGSNISTTNEAIINLTFDKDKFLEAFEADQDAVKDLLIGGANNTGVFTKVETLLESALQGVSGYFATTEESYKREVNRLDERIVKTNKDIERYRARLEAKFASMDMLIAQMQQQYSTFLTT